MFSISDIEGGINQSYLEQSYLNCTC